MNEKHLGDVKRRILDAIDVIGHPANIHEIKDVGSFDLQIHSRISELVKTGWLIKVEHPGELTRYALANQPIDDEAEAAPAEPSTEEHRADEPVAPAQSMAEATPDPLIDLILAPVFSWRTAPSVHAARLRALAASRMHQQVQEWLLELADDIERAA